MARTSSGSLTGRAAATHLRELREELLEEQLKAARAEREAIKAELKAKFAAALDELKNVMPDWEAWYDDDNNIPPLFHWGDRAYMEKIIARIIAKTEEISKQVNNAKEVSFGTNEWFESVEEIPF